MITIPMRVSINEITLPMSVVASTQVIPMKVSAAYYTINAPAYEGEYEVTPRLHDPIVMETAEKLMQDDVTIHEIPITRTTNPQNGITVLIG